VLRPDGGLALLWNLRGWPELGALVDELSGGKATYPGEQWADVLDDDDRFGPVEERHYETDETLPRERLLDDVRSRSYVASLPDARRTALLDEVERFLGDALEFRRRRPTVVYRCLRL
jgi:hypothetical protein